MNHKRSARRAIAVAFLLTAYSLTIATRLATAQTCGAAGCTSGPTNYDSNQGGNASYCLNKDCQSGGNCGTVTDPYLTVPANTSTMVASDNAGAYSDNSWNYGVSGQVLIANANSSNTATVTMTTYIGDQALCGSNLGCYFSIAGTVTLRPGEADWIPFTSIDTLANPSDYQAFFVFLQSNYPLHCVAESYYSFEHD